MKRYWAILKSIWTSYIWYGWIAILTLLSWPIIDWQRHIIVTILFSLILPIVVIIDRWAE